MDWILQLPLACWSVLGQMAPYLLFGFLMAGVLSVCISPEWVERHLGGRGLSPIVKASLFGVPLPLCSCGVIPVMASIRKHGASRGATTGFLLSTPQTGIDSIMATYALLGPVFAVFRPVVAFLTGVLGGGLVSLFEDDAKPVSGKQDAALVCTDSCCSSGPRAPALKRIFKYGFVTLPGDIAKALLAGIVVAGCISVFLSQNALAPYLGGGLAAMLIMMAVGIPIYVCSTASIPIALGFMHLGASPGAALTFLISGPATNAAAIAVVWKLLGRRTGILYLLTVAAGALLAGFALDAIYAWFPGAGFAMSQHVHGEGMGWLGHVSAVLLLAVLAGNLIWGHLPKKGGGALMTSANETPLPRIRLTVTGMTCSHCANAVLRALRGSAGVSDAEVDLASGQAVVVGESLDVEALMHAVRELGYDVSLADGV